MKRCRWRAVTKGVVLTIFLALVFGITAEIKTSWLQSELLSSFARGLTFSLEPGPSPAIRFPSSGPYNRRLGYVDLPRFLERLDQQSFEIERQARLSPRHLSVIDHGGFPIFREKTRAGLTLLDQHGERVFEARFPERTYDTFEMIPPVVVETLLFIENRELLDPSHPHRNPAVEWDRLLAVLPAALAHLAHPTTKVDGASTLATQLEKYRHAPHGRTGSIASKLRQMVSASLRAYLHGPDTTAARRQIVLDYLNSTPLSARGGLGEVNGLGDGLWAWFGTELEMANQVLGPASEGPEQHVQRARVYKQVLSLLLAQRRPSYYLISGRNELAKLTESYLHLLMRAGIIDAQLGRAALDLELEFRRDPPRPRNTPHFDHKAANAIRGELLPLLGVRGLYQLDRLDLDVETSLVLQIQRRVSALLRQLTDPALALRLGLYGHRLLDAGKPSDALVYSLTLFQRGAGANYLQVQADNLDQPFDVNQGAKLDLGSTAKLRTLITYLEILAELQAQLHELQATQLRAIAREASDPLTRWVADHLASTDDRSLRAVLQAAMARRYSASPWQTFFTGGGVHRFVNFDPKHNRQVLSVAKAFRHSVNLVFVRLMRDIVKYFLATGNASNRELLADPKHPLREDYLVRFADREGSTFLNQFYTEFYGLNPHEALDLLANQVRPRADRLSVTFRSVRPLATRAELAAFLEARLPGRTFSEAVIHKLYTSYSIDRFPLAERAYLAGVHPLKLWLVGYLQEHPQSSRAAVLAASEAARQASYAWLFRTQNKRTQDRRIRILLEEEAFARIHETWQRLGYPFDQLVPSYATAIGSSADRPEALAELIGIILNDGVWQPTVRVERLHFAGDTPYETVVRFNPAPAKRVLASEIAAVVRDALIDVVEAGTARRVHGAFVGKDGASILVGAKTGTGDHRKKRFGKGGRLIGSEVVDRTATVVFFIGERFFGNITIYVSGAGAADFGFTSSLPAQLLKAIAPALEPLLDGDGAHTTSANHGARAGGPR